MELFLAAFFTGRLNLPALRGIGAPRTDASVRRGMLQDLKGGIPARLFSQTNLFPLVFAALTRPCLGHSAGRGFESFGPAEPLPPFLFFGPGNLTLLEAAAASSAALVYGLPPGELTAPA